MSAQNIATYRVFACNVRNKKIYVLDPAPGTTNKQENIDRCIRTIKQIQQNLTSVVKRVHQDYDEKIPKSWESFIANNVPPCSK